MLVYWFVLLMIGALLPVRGEPVPLRVGMELAYPPFEMTDAQGQPSGVSVDLAHELGHYLKRPVEIRNTAFAGLVPALKAGTIDCVISSMTATPERAKAIAFSDPYVKTGLAMLVRKGSNLAGIRDADAPQWRVAVKKGTTGHLYAAKHLTQAKVLIFDMDAACVLELTQGKADVFIYDQLSVLQHAQRHPETTEPRLQAFQEEYWAIGLPLNNETLRSEVNRFLTDFRGRGGFLTLANKHLRVARESFARLGVPFLFDL